MRKKHFDRSALRRRCVWKRQAPNRRRPQHSFGACRKQMAYDTFQLLDNNRMRSSLKILIGVLILTGLVAIIASRLTVMHVLVGNRTALGAQSIESALSNYEVEQGSYPPLEFNLDELAVGREGGPYLSGPPRDAW